MHAVPSDEPCFRSKIIGGGGGRMRVCTRGRRLVKVRYLRASEARVWSSLWHLPSKVPDFEAWQDPESAILSLALLPRGQQLRCSGLLTPVVEYSESTADGSSSDFTTVFVLRENFQLEYWKGVRDAKSRCKNHRIRHSSGNLNSDPESVVRIIAICKPLAEIYVNALPLSIH